MSTRRRITSGAGCLSFHVTTKPKRGSLMAGTGVRSIDQFKPLLLFNGTPSSYASLWLDMAYYSQLSFYILVSNSTTVTGAAITLKQATSSTGTSSKALTYNNYFSAIGLFASQAATQDVWTQVTGVSGTFTTNTTNSVLSAYCIEVHDTDLDLTNAFSYVQLLANPGTATTIAIFALAGVARYGGNYSINPTVLT
jgi:hypothetical protein